MARTKPTPSRVRSCTAEELEHPQFGVFYFTCKRCGHFAVDLGSSKRERQLVVRTLVTGHLTEQEAA